MKRFTKAAAALLSGMLAVSSLPFSAMTTSAADGDILVTGFEDGDVSMFAKRGDTDTSVIGTTTDSPYAGTTCMAVTERSKGWNGPSLALNSVGCEAGVQYLASAWVKTQWYNTINLSMQYSDADGTQHYSNLTSVVSQGDWVQIPETKFSFSSDMLDVQIYIEGSDAADLFVDDFSLTLAPTYNIQTDIASLKDVYADYFKIGGAVTASELAPQSTKDLILKHYNSLTLGNELKPENMLDQAATIAYMNETGDNTTPIVSLKGSARIILNFCRDNNIPVRGHVLVWHSQTPGWFFKEDYTLDGAWVDVDTMTKRMEAYIKGVFEVLEEEYSDVDFYAWDVVNEAWLDDGTPRKGGTYEENSNYSGWTQIWGDNSFIELAFKFARQYAPGGCKLYYNDFNEYMPQKTTAMVEMANDLASKGLIDGIGLQSHLDVSFPGISAYRTAITKFAATGLDIQVTELDATTSDTSEAGFETQAQYYSDIMDVLVEYADSISAVVFWGTTDDQSWRASRCPLLFNEDYTAKPAYYAIIDGITYTTTASTATTTTTSTEETFDETSDCEVVFRGDVDDDQVAGTLADAVTLAKAIGNVEGAELSTTGRRNSDLNDDGDVDSNDLRILLQYIANIIQTL